MHGNISKRKKGFIAAAVIIVLAGLPLFAVYGYHWLKIIRYLCLIAFLLILAAIDYEKKIVPNKILAVMFLLRTFLLVGEILCFPAYIKEFIINSFGGAAIGILFFLLAYFFSRGSIGFGDVKLVGVMGWYLGLSLIWWDIVVCFLLSALYSVVQLARKKLKLKDSVPLVPFLAAGTLLVLYIGF